MVLALRLWTRGSRVVKSAVGDEVEGKKDVKGKLTDDEATEM